MKKLATLAAATLLAASSLAFADDTANSSVQAMPLQLADASTTTETTVDTDTTKEVKADAPKAKKHVKKHHVKKKKKAVAPLDTAPSDDTTQ